MSDQSMKGRGPTGMKRRGFLKRLGGLGALGVGGATLAGGGLWGGGLSGLARAAESAATAPAGLAKRHYIFCYFYGGWDVLLSLDPRDPTVFGNGTMGTTKIQPGYELADVAAPYMDVLRDGQMYLGQHVGELADVADRITVVRGMSMDTLTHEVGRRRFLTGRPPSGLTARGSSTDTWFSSVIGADAPIPNLAVRMESYNNADLPTWASALGTNTVADLQRVLSPAGPSLGALEQRELDALIAQASGCPEAQRSPLWQVSQVARAKSRQMLDQNLFGLFDFGSNEPLMRAIRDRYQIPGTSASALASPAAMAAVATTAIMNGISRVVSVRINSGSLDTHFDNWSTDQGRLQEGGFNAIARMIRHLEAVPYPDGSGDSWFDHTVIVGFSEFSRSPLLNNNGGRDHWLMNAALLAGGPIARGKVIGASSNLGMSPLPVDLATGAPCATDPDLLSPCPEEPGRVEVLKPEHLLQTLYEDLGLRQDEADLRVPPLKALLA